MGSLSNALDKTIEYISTRRVISIANLEKEKPCSGGLEKFTYLILRKCAAIGTGTLSYSGMIPHELAIEVAIEIPGGIQFLVEHGFLMPVEEVYKRGQKFSGSGGDYMLVIISSAVAGINAAAFINEGSGVPFSAGVSVAQSTEITQAEFYMISGGGTFFRRE